MYICIVLIFIAFFYQTILEKNYTLIALLLFHKIHENYYSNFLILCSTLKNCKILYTLQFFQVTREKSLINAYKNYIISINSFFTSQHPRYYKISLRKFVCKLFNLVDASEFFTVP